jgi:hypothetical protein
MPFLNGHTLFGHLRANPPIGEQLQQDGVAALAVDDGHFFDTVFNGIRAYSIFGIIPPLMLPSAIMRRMVAASMEEISCRRHPLPRLHR